MLHLVMLLLTLLLLMYISLQSFSYICVFIRDCDPGKGAVYSFDPVGSYQRDSYKAGGSASAMLQPLLDNQVKLTDSRK